MSEKRLELELATGDNAGQRVALAPYGPSEIGRAATSAISLADDPRVSGRHFAVEFVDRQWIIRDLQSTNGTFVNGQRVAESVLKDGDEIAVGQTKFVVGINEESESSTGPGVGVTAEVRRPAAALSTPPAGDLAENDDGPPARELLALTNGARFVAGTLLTETAPDRALLTIVIKATFTIAPNGEVAWAAEQLPLFWADVLEVPDNPASPARFETDMIPFKPRADVVLVGRACAPGRPRVRQLDVRLRVGPIDKTIRVFGNRRWSYPSRLAIAPRIVGPEPFQEMELSYRRAFGGIDAAAALYCAENLAGVGFAGQCSEESLHDRALPNLEDPRQLITSWDSRPKPVGFGFYGRGWAPRLKYAGSYDEDYVQRRHPLPPEDFAHDFYNGAHPQLQAVGYLHGGENVDLYNVHPDGPLHFTLPRVRPLVTISRYAAASENARSDYNGDILVGNPLMPPFDTLVLIPERRKFYEVFRCPIPLAGLESLDVSEITIAALEP